MYCAQSILRLTKGQGFAIKAMALFKQVYHQFHTILTAPLPDVEDSALWS